jgi:biotin operon repressor
MQPEQLAFDFDLTREEQAIINRLWPGRANVTSRRTISAETGIEERRVRQIIKHLRERHGYSIGSSSGHPAGYYIISDPKELEEFIGTMRHRGISILFMVAKVTGNSLETVFHQGKLELLESEKRA